MTKFCSQLGWVNGLRIPQVTNETQLQACLCGCLQGGKPEEGGLILNVCTTAPWPGVQTDSYREGESK